jgi:hypothetical protein
MGCRVEPGNDRKEPQLPLPAVMAGRKTRPSTPGEQLQFAVRQGLSSRTPGSRVTSSSADIRGLVTFVS